jgi:hypothetical protein
LSRLPPRPRSKLQLLTLPFWSLRVTAGGIRNSMFDLFELLRRGRCATGTESSLGSGSASQTRVAHWCALRQLTPIACLIITDINGNVHGGLSAFVVDPGSAVDPVHSRSTCQVRKCPTRASADHRSHAGTLMPRPCLLPAAIAADSKSANARAARRLTIEATMQL